MTIITDQKHKVISISLIPGLTEIPEGFHMYFPADIKKYGMPSMGDTYREEIPQEELDVKQAATNYIQSIDPDLFCQGEVFSDSGYTSEQMIACFEKAAGWREEQYLKLGQSGLSDWLLTTMIGNLDTKQLNALVRYCLAKLGTDFNEMEAAGKAWAIENSLMDKYWTQTGLPIFMAGAEWYDRKIMMESKDWEYMVNVRDEYRSKKGYERETPDEQELFDYLEDNYRLVKK